ncbi:hemolysin family protein [Mangrovicella endophytica]|uniref:hemolysin family protein n=1 Tax=Mangrovicella endophytica TaxID=2066697 RepID=UPI000C9E58C6
MTDLSNPGRSSADTAALSRPEAAGGDEPPSVEDRSRSTGEARAERGFLGQLFQRLRPRVPRAVREELADALLQPGVGEDAFSTEERSMLNNILRLREIRVEDVMVPRADVHALDLGTTLGELMVQFEFYGHSRMPVYGDTLDDARGMVHIRDVLAHLTRTARTDGGGGSTDEIGDVTLDLHRIDLTATIEAAGLVRPVLFVPPSMPATELMARMQATRTQMALVVDEYGGTDGLVSLEDIIEMVVGDIEDEHDDEEAMIVQRGEGIFFADARAELDDLRAAIGDDFDIADYLEESDTVGGLLFSELGRVPARGEVIEVVPGFAFKVLDASPRRVRRVKISRVRPGETRQRLAGGLAGTP